MPRKIKVGKSNPQGSEAKQKPRKVRGKYNKSKYEASKAEHKAKSKLQGDENTTWLDSIDPSILPLVIGPPHVEGDAAVRKGIYPPKPFYSLDEYVAIPSDRRDESDGCVSDTCNERGRDIDECDSDSDDDSDLDGENGAASAPQSLSLPIDDKPDGKGRKKGGMKALTKSYGSKLTDALSGQYESLESDCHPLMCTLLEFKDKEFVKRRDELVRFEVRGGVDVIDTEIFLMNQKDKSLVSSGPMGKSVGNDQVYRSVILCGNNTSNFGAVLCSLQRGKMLKEKERKKDIKVKKKRKAEFSARTKDEIRDGFAGAMDRAVTAFIPSNPNAKRLLWVTWNPFEKKYDKFYNEEMMRWRIEARVRYIKERNIAF